MDKMASLTVYLIVVSSLLSDHSRVFGDSVGRVDETGNGGFGQRSFVRDGRSLLNTFPFNGGHHDHDHAHQHDHDGAHHNHHQHQEEDGNRLGRQGSGRDNEVPLDIGSIAAAGERCIDKVVMVQETEYDDVIECKHSYSERCHTTYTTDYQPQQEEECDENFKKQCYIEYKNVAFPEKVKFCYTPLVRDCNTPGPIECQTEYRSECTTRYHEHDVEDDVPECREEKEQKCQQVTQGYTTEEKCSNWPLQKCTLNKQKTKKYTPETECKKVPFELCGPSGCPVVPGPEECQDKTETVVQEVPEETCSLEPQVECKFVTKLVPLLKPAENCIDIPKEVCVRTRRNPRKISKPIVKKWCYTPTKESGLLPSPTTSAPTTRRPNGGFDNGNNNQGRNTPQPIGPPPVQETGCVAGYPSDHCPKNAANGKCNPECDTQACGFDGGDCRPQTPPTTQPTTTISIGRTTPPPSGCAPGLPAGHCESKSNNRRCDLECNIPSCNFDGGECNAPPSTQPPNVYLPPKTGY